MALGLLVAILRQPGVSHVRRWIGMLTDYAAMGAIMCIQGEPLSPLYAVLPVGDDRQRHALRQSLPARRHGAGHRLSFLRRDPAVAVLARQPYLSWGLLIGLVAVPLYFARCCRP